MIADNLKVGGVSPPPGAISWKWIDTSVKNGLLEDKDDYLIGRREGSAREAGTVEKKKGTRTPFTKHDDLILTKWVQAEERMGHTVRGNQIFQALEQRHQQHPWQSWRSRWINLSNRPPVAIPEEELQAEVEVHKTEASAAVVEHSRPARSATRSAAAAQPGPSTTQRRTIVSVAAPRSSGPLGRKKFTGEEDQRLMSFINAMREKNRQANKDEDSNLKGNVFYKDFAAQVTRTLSTWSAYTHIANIRE